MMSPKVWESLPSPPSFPFLLSFLFSFLAPLLKRRRLSSTHPSGGRRALRIPIVIMDYLHTGATLGASPLDVASLERLTGIPRASLVVVPAGATRFVFDARLLEAGMPPPAPDPFRATPPPPPHLGAPRMPST